jgi:hypothetical protein
MQKSNGGQQGKCRAFQDRAGLPRQTTGLNAVAFPEESHRSESGPDLHEAFTFGTHARSP